jgi:hypothetical protein
MQRIEHVPEANRSGTPGERPGSFDLGTGYDSTDPQSARDVSESAATGTGTAPAVPGSRPATDDDLTAGRPETETSEAAETDPDLGDRDEFGNRAEPATVPYPRDGAAAETTDSSDSSDSSVTNDELTDSDLTDSPVAESEVAGPAVSDSEVSDSEVRGSEVRDSEARADADAAAAAAPADTPAAAPAGTPVAVAGETAGQSGVHRAPGDDTERLFTGDQSTGFRGRWREVQAGFVDDPKAAVAAAESLLHEVTSALTSAVEARSKAGDATDTEALRTRLRSYRTVVERLLDV